MRHLRWFNDENAFSSGFAPVFFLRESRFASNVSFHRATAAPHDRGRALFVHKNIILRTTGELDQKNRRDFVSFLVFAIFFVACAQCNT